MDAKNGKFFESVGNFFSKDDQIRWCDSDVVSRKMGSSNANGGGERGGALANGGVGVVDKGVDYAKYFRTYSFLYHQKDMLSDRVRMDAYFNSIFQNKHHFLGKTVLDVGTGSGILAIWSAQAGARKVYAVEATKMSEHARSLVKANGLEGIVEVIEGSMEDVSLPEKVDVIISEWMGYFLLRESMLDSVICARDRWLKHTGVMYPSHARMWVAPITSHILDQKRNHYEGDMGEWYSLIDDTKSSYGVDMSILTDPYREEQYKQYLQTSVLYNLNPDQVIGTAATVKEIDLLTTTVDDILKLKTQFNSLIQHKDVTFVGFGGWFDVHFRGRSESPTMSEIELTTAPSLQYNTHWGQQVFLFNSPIRCSKGDNINVSFLMNRSKENHRLLEVELGVEVKLASGRSLQPFKKKYFIE